MRERREEYGDVYIFLEPEEGILPPRWRNEEGRNRVLVIPPFELSLYPNLPLVPPYDPSRGWNVCVPHLADRARCEWGMGQWFCLLGEGTEQRAFAIAGPYADQLHSADELDKLEEEDDCDTDH